MLKNTAWGRHVYAIGDDAEAARLAGVRTDRVLLSVYIVAGLICAVAAWMLIGRIASASPQAGLNANLDSITAVVIGGTSLFGGRGLVIGTLFGALIVGVLRNGLDACGHRRSVAGLRRGRAHHRGSGDRPVDPEGEGMTTDGNAILEARGLVKRYGHVTALAGSDFDLRPGEVLAVIGDNGAGKSSLIKCLSGAVVPDEGEILLDGKPIQMRTPIDARAYGIETVYQTLAVSPSLDIADNLFLGREPRAPGVMGKVFRKLDRGKMRAEAKQQMTELGIMTIQDITQMVESLSGGQRQGVAVARAAAFGSKVMILDEPTAALGVKESAHVLELILKVRDSGIPVILISHNMPHVFEVADRIHIHRLGKRIAVVTPKTHTMNEVVAIMTGATEPGAVGYEQVVKDAERADAAHVADAIKTVKEK